MQGEQQLNDCQKRWRIIEFKEQFKGKVLFHAKASIACGVLATGSVTIVQVPGGTIYRVIEYCNIDKDFPTGSSVVITPNTNANIPLIPIDKYQCDLKETLFGSVEAQKN